MSFVSRCREKVCLLWQLRPPFSLSYVCSRVCSLALRNPPCVSAANRCRSFNRTYTFTCVSTYVRVCFVSCRVTSCFSGSIYISSREIILNVCEWRTVTQICTGKRLSALLNVTSMMHRARSCVHSALELSSPCLCLVRLCAYVLPFLFANSCLVSIGIRSKNS